METLKIMIKMIAAISLYDKLLLPNKTMKVK